MAVRCKTPTITAIEAARLAPKGSRVYAAGCLGEPSAILEAVAREKDAWQDVRLTGAFIPGANRRDLSALGLRTRVETIFATPEMRPERAAGHVDLLPLHYSTYDQWLSTPGSVDIAYFNVTAPRRDGSVGLGPSADFSPAVLRGGSRAIGVVNERLPDVVDGPRFPVERFEALVEDDAPLITYDSGELDAATTSIAEKLCGEIKPRETIQLGLGKLQTAMLRRLKRVRGLGFHGGMLSEAFLGAYEAGTFSRGAVAGVALGNPDFVKTIAALDGAAFRPVSSTHAASTLAAIPNLVSINSVIEVDLFGQANAEFMNGVQISGHGGLVDFVRGARASTGGRSILALPSTADGGKVSRIGAALYPASPISVGRSEVDIVATEHGIASLRHLGMDARAEALISIASPDFRNGLARSWDKWRRRSTPRRPLLTGVRP